jgi:hypothetical protein
MNRLTCCSLLALLAGCSATPHYDAHFGDAVREARRAMTINPQPPNPAPPAGLDGQAAGAAVIRYQESFKAPPPVVKVINVGGAAATPE